ncbi:hypothetical protein [Thalassobacillus hwangdonensis]|uniref:Uncharacterized protein n=1 Tax=Thalassobacillus hwangdonensis TaxID=546108 RepID=A0ABW3L5E1_9BACI
MAEKKFEELMKSMKCDYDNVSIETDEDKIMDRLPSKRKRPTWIRALSYGSALAAAAALFIILSLGYINEDASKQGDEVQNQEVPGSLIETFDKNKERFEKSLGVGDASEFEEVKQAKRIVEVNKGEEDPEKIEDAQLAIIEWFQTPEMELKIAVDNADGRSDTSFAFSLRDVTSKLEIFKPSMQAYWERVVSSEGGLSQQESETIIEALNNGEDYRPSKEINHALNVLEKQGYTLVPSLGKDIKLLVMINHDWILEKLDDSLITEELKSYYDIQDELEVLYASQDADESHSWMDSQFVLLQIEEHLEKYNKDDPYHQQAILTGEAGRVLSIFVSAGVNVGEEIPAEAEGVFEDFLDENQTSKFYGLVNTALQTYEENDWRREGFEIYGQLIDMMYRDYDPENQPQFPYDRIRDNIALIPQGELQDVYENYSQSQNDLLLEGLSAYDVMRLYMMASDEDDFETVYALTMKQDNYGYPEDKEQWREEFLGFDNAHKYLNLEHDTGYVLEYIDEGPEDVEPNNPEKRFTFLNENGEVVTGGLAFRMVQREDGVWKVPHMSMQ